MVDLQQLPEAGQEGGAEPAFRVRLGGEEPEVVLQILSDVAQTPFLSRGNPDREDDGNLAAVSTKIWIQVATGRDPLTHRQQGTPFLHGPISTATYDFHRLIKNQSLYLVEF